MTPDERFHVGSVTKLITALAAIKLIERKKLSLGSKVADILTDSVIFQIPHIQDITVRNLLEHTSGIYSTNNDLEYIGSILGEDARSKKWTNKELLLLSDSIRLKPFGEPNTRTYYGDANYILLDLIIEKVSNKTLRQFVKENIIEVLELESTAYFGFEDNNKKTELTSTTQGYIKNSNTIESILKISERFPRVNDSLINSTLAVDLIDGAAGIVSTCKDLLTIGRHLFKNKLVNHEGLKLIMSPAEKMKESSIGEMRRGILQVFKRNYGYLYAAT